MGDADSEIIVPIEEIESWMDEAFEVVDEGLDHLYLYITNLNDRTKQILVKLRCLEYFRNWFMALNLLIVPVIFAILICYNTRNTIDGSGLEPGFQLAVTFLMFISVSIGLPFYLYSLWDSYRRAEKLKKEVTIRMSQDLQSLENHRLNRMPPSEDSLLTLVSREASAERISELIRLLSERLPEEMRERLERRLNARFSERNEERENERSRSENSEQQPESGINSYSSMHSVDTVNNKVDEPPLLSNSSVAETEKSGDCQLKALIDHGMEDQLENIHFAVTTDLIGNIDHEPKSQEVCPKEDNYQDYNISCVPTKELPSIWLRNTEENLTKEDLCY